MKRKKVSVARFCVAAFSLFGGRAEAGLQCYEINGEWLFGDTSFCWVEDVNRKFGTVGGKLTRCTSAPDYGVSKNMLEWVNAGDRIQIVTPLPLPSWRRCWCLCNCSVCTIIYCVHVLHDDVILVFYYGNARSNIYMHSWTSSGRQALDVTLHKAGSKCWDDTSFFYRSFRLSTLSLSCFFPSILYPMRTTRCKASLLPVASKLPPTSTMMSRMQGRTSSVW